VEALAWLLVLCACPAAALVTALAIGLAIGNRGQTSKLTLRLDELDRTVGELRARLELIGSTGPPPSVPSSSAPPLDERTGPVAEPAPPPLIPPAPRSDEPAPVVLKDEARPAALDVGLEVPPTEAPAAPAAEGVTAAVEPAGPPPDEVEDEAAAAEAGPDVGPAIDAAAREVEDEAAAAEARPDVGPAIDEAARELEEETGDEGPLDALIDRVRGLSWERLVGIWGAAIVGGMILALAGILLFKYAIDAGMITPGLRVAMGLGGGLLFVALAQLTPLRAYAMVSNALTGAGLVALYASLWAGHALYDLVGSELAFGSLAVVTVACGGLALYRSSLLIALLGLVGGMATPLLSTIGLDRPLALFGYVLLLDLAFLALAGRKRWSALVPASLAGTLLYQTLWAALEMGAGERGSALGVLALFAAVYAVAGRFVAEEDRRVWTWTGAAALLLPFNFVLVFAAFPRFGSDLWPLAMLLLLLVVLAGWMVRAQPWIGAGIVALAVSLGVLAIVAVWLLGYPITTARFLEAAAVLVVLALVPHVFVELARDDVGPGGPAWAGGMAAWAGGGLLAVATVPTPSSVPPWPAIGGAVLCALLVLRQGMLPRRAELNIGAALLLGAALGLPLLNERGEGFPPFGFYLAVLGLTAVGVLLWARWVAPEAARRRAFQAAALLSLGLIPTLAVIPHLIELPTAQLLGAVVGLGLLVAVAATRLDQGGWYLAASLTSMGALGVWVLRHPVPTGVPSVALTALLVGLGGVIALVAWPFLAGPSFRRSRLAWYGAALAGVAWFPTGRFLFDGRFGDHMSGVPPLVLGLICCVAIAAARRAWPVDDPVRRSVIVWFSAVALGFGTAAIPLQLEHQWLTIGWALEGMALLLLWRRLDHPGLKYFALVLFAAVTVRLVLNPFVLDYEPRSTIRILNWIAYTYLVPATAMLVGARVLAARELPQARSWEQPLYSWGRAIFGPLVTVAALVIVFVWINLAVFDWFADGDQLRVDLARQPARDLSLSICWAVYALVLLAIGVVRRSGGYRWGSLVLLLVTIGKAFLYDLGWLEDLYRVASLVGLAVSLLAVSVVYQRFVFRKPRADERPTDPAEPPDEPEPPVEPPAEPEAPAEPPAEPEAPAGSPDAPAAPPAAPDVPDEAPDG